MTVEQKIEFFKKKAAEWRKRAEAQQSKKRENRSSQKKERVKKEKQPKKERSKSHKPSKGSMQQKESQEVRFTDKDDLVNEFARGWWYALPREWPPLNYDYTAALVENKLKLVEPMRWKSEPEEDSLGYRKVQEIEFFPGVFRDS